ncbi:hypothetical protein [Pontimicrobium sp. MEBiC01747]
MGLMGFGMDNRVHRKRPKKPYKISNITSFVPLQGYSRKFTLKKNEKEKSQQKGALILLIVLIISCFFFIERNNFVKYQKEHNELMDIRKAIDNNIAFRFLMESGISRLHNNNVLGAYSEFKLAYKIYPENEKLKQLIIETASVLCAKEETYCNDLDNYLTAN